MNFFFQFFSVCGTMFQDVFQGGLFVEVFSTVDKSLLALWKTSCGVARIYDTQAKTHVYYMGGTAPVPKMQLPADRKKKLGLRQPIIVFQILMPLEANILIDIGITFTSDRRTRITLSTNRKEIKITPLWAGIPLIFKSVNVWTHFCINVYELSQSLWQNEVLKTIDSLSLSGVFRLKRIFTVDKQVLVKRADVWFILYEKLPKHLLLPHNLLQVFHVISSIDVKRKDAKPISQNVAADDIDEIGSFQSASVKNLGESRASSACSSRNSFLSSHSQNRHRGFSFYKDVLQREQGKNVLPHSKFKESKSVQSVQENLFNLRITTSKNSEYEHDTMTGDQGILRLSGLNFAESTESPPAKQTNKPEYKHMKGVISQPSNSATEDSTVGKILNSLDIETEQEISSNQKVELWLPSLTPVDDADSNMNAIHMSNQKETGIKKDD